MTTAPTEADATGVPAPVARPARGSRFLDALDSAAIWLSAAILVAMLLLMNVEVALRYLAHASTRISEEYGEYALGFISLLCFAPALRGGRLLQVQSVIRRLPLRAQAVLELVAGLICAGLSAVLTYGGLRILLDSWRFGSVSLQYSQTPLFIPQVVLPLGLAILTIASIEYGISRFRQLWNGHELPEEHHVVD